MNNREYPGIFFSNFSSYPFKTGTCRVKPWYYYCYGCYHYYCYCCYCCYYYYYYYYYYYCCYHYYYYYYHYYYYYCYYLYLCNVIISCASRYRALGATTGRGSAMDATRDQLAGSRLIDLRGGKTVGAKKVRGQLRLRPCTTFHRGSIFGGCNPPSIPDEKRKNARK